MPNILDATGLQIATLTEVVNNLTTALQAIYGADINVESDTPDGQWLNIIAQSAVDVEELLMQIYNSMDPDLAIGAVLDQRCAINGIIRQAGTFSTVGVALVITQSTNLYGLDQDLQPVYTVQDNAGTQWQLFTTQLGVGAGTHTYTFQAAVPGQTLVSPNTITVPVTIVLGVQSLNNPGGLINEGVNEESDALLRVRRQQSVSLSSQGYLAGLLAALENINGVTAAFVYENDTDATDGDGVPSHSIWVIVAGSGSAADIANAIYTKRNAGCGMFGDITYTVTQVNGSPFVVRWDDVVTQPLYISFDATPLDPTKSIDPEAIKASLAALYSPGVNAEVNINQLSTLVQQIDPNCLVTFVGLGSGTTGLSSTGVPGSYAATATPTLKKNQFQVLGTNILINGA